MAEPAYPAPVDDDTAAFVEGGRDSVVAANACNTVPYEAVRRWLLSWGTEAELPCPSTITAHLKTQS